MIGEPAGYRVGWTSPDRRDVGRLPAKIATAILAFVDDWLANDPRRLSKPLVGELSGLRSARNGDFRILFELDDDAGEICIFRVHHRAHAYRPG